MADRLIQVHAALFNLLQFPIPTPATGGIVLMISIATGIWSVSNILEDMFLNPNPLFFTKEQSYDFIIVGGGSAGLVLANRLSESGTHHVLVLEAGGDPSLLNSIPELAPYNLHHHPTDWKYKTVPQINACQAFYNNRLPWPRGRVLGGCSTLNWMIYQRGSPKDYDLWVDATGDPQWSYDNLLSYFRKSETYHGSFPNPNFHGTDGPLHVSKQYYVPCIKEWVDAGKELGFDTTTDPNSRQVNGFYPTDVTIFEGMRQSTYVAFLKPIMNRSNLKIYRHAHVIRVNLDDSKKATGVTYIRDGLTLTATATKEIILSAGAIGTPHLLMLSGIGAPAHLQSVGVNPLVNLPGVGQNLYDHVLTMFGPFLINEPISFLSDRDLNINAAVDYVKNRTGPFSFNELSGVGFISTSQSTDPTWSNIEFHQTPLGLRKTAADDFTSVFGLKPDILPKYYAKYLEEDANFVMVDLGRPFSVGEITLKTSDPFTHPDINPKYFSHPSDMHAMVEALQFLLRFYEGTQTWQKVGARLAPGHFPGCENFVWKSPGYLECYIRHMTLTIYHPCCTAKMGRSSDPKAVVDTNLRVIGVTGLRVADASVMPTITNANLNAPTIMIGEKAANFLLQSWGF